MKKIYTNFLSKAILLLLAALFATPIWAQIINISGRVIDDDTEEGVAFCSIFFNSSTPIGVTSDVDGYYTFKIDFSVVQGDSIGAISIGYGTQKKTVLRNVEEQTINFRLKSSSLTTGDVVVLAGENPANEIIRQIIKSKKRNDPKNFDSYEVQLYSKTELDLNNIDPDMKDSKLFKEVQFIFENVDSVSDVKPFLPAYVAERVYEVYSKKNTIGKEILKAQKVSGITNGSVVDFINRLHEKYSIYDNYITMLGKEFISPFSNTALLTYEFYILDSTYIQGEWSYKLKFKPKRKQENTYSGDFWVSMETYAIEIVNMRMSPDVNINLVNRVIIYQDFIKKDSLWLPHKEKTIIDFDVDKKEKRPGIVGRKTQMYKNFIINDPTTIARYQEADPEEINWEEVNKDSSYWKENRHEQLSKNEEAVYKMVDSIKQVPIYKTAADILNTLGGGYQVIGLLEIGPYWDIINRNDAEGWRFGMGLGTSYKFSKKLRLYGYGAYGFYDKRWKYRGLFEYIFDNYRRKELGVQYRNDVTLDSRSTEEPYSQGLFAGFIRRNGIPAKIMRNIEAKAFYHHTWKRGWSNHLAFIYRELTPVSDSFTISKRGFNFGFYPNIADPTTMETSVATAEIMFRTRYAYKERLLRGNFSDVSLGSVYPIVELSYTAGIKGILRSKYNYHRINLTLKHWFYTGAAGWLEYNIEAGKVFGRVPYLFLETHPGNDAYFYNKSAYNMMNSFEFVSDTWIGLRIEQHLDGFIFNRIPLIRKLKWREVLFVRGVWGTLSAENEAANILNEQINSGPYYGSFDKGPYIEAGCGIENIFKFFRIDALWRLNYWDNQYAQKFSVRFTMNFNF